MITKCIHAYIQNHPERNAMIGISFLLDQKHHVNLASELGRKELQFPFRINILGVYVTFFKESRKTADTNDVMFNKLANFFNIQ